MADKIPEQTTETFMSDETDLRLKNRWHMSDPDRLSTRGAIAAAAIAITLVGFTIASIYKGNSVKAKTSAAITESAALSVTLQQKITYLQSQKVAIEASARYCFDHAVDKKEQARSTNRPGSFQKAPEAYLAAQQAYQSCAARFPADPIATYAASAATGIQQTINELHRVNEVNKVQIKELIEDCRSNTARANAVERPPRWTANGHIDYNYELAHADTDPAPPLRNVAYDAKNKAKELWEQTIHDDDSLYAGIDACDKNQE